MNVFSNYAKYYDLLYFDKNYDKEVDYLKKLIKKHAPKAKTVFEMGCGTGLHAIKLAENGFSVDGIDISEDMLKGADKRLSELPAELSSKLSFHKGDVRDYQSDKQYDVTLSLFHIINYQPTNEDLLNMLSVARKHTKDKGIFIFDSWYGPTVLTDRPVVRSKVFENEDIKVVRIARPDMYPNENRVDVNYDILVIDKPSKKAEEIHETHSMRYLFKPEVELLLRESGFILRHAEAWLTGKEPGFDTWGVSFIAQAN